MTWNPVIYGKQEQLEHDNDMESSYWQSDKLNLRMLLRVIRHALPSGN
ncbi:hypothetical protein M6D81_28995 [Paenibacillus sp. J5C_2022]|nr:hypothetical protein [Paenibacillus sp. J5C2022]